MDVALSIAGSDSGGGAGIQADLKTFERFGVFGTSVITCVTAQNTLGVRGWEPVSPALVREQMDAVADDLPPAAFKTGMLGTIAIARAVAAGIVTNGLRNFVLDPVLVATSGDHLSDDGLAAVIRSDLLAHAILVTPNSEEAAALTGRPVNSADDAARAAESLVREHGAAAALVTGGHLGGDEVIDVLYTGHARFFRAPRIRSTGTHGTGCTLSAAITAGIAAGISLEEAVAMAIGYVRSAIETAPKLGGGRGPLNHKAGVGAPADAERNSSTSR